MMKKVEGKRSSASWWWWWWWWCILVVRKVVCLRETEIKGLQFAKRREVVWRKKQVTCVIEGGGSFKKCGSEGSRVVERKF